MGGMAWKEIPRYILSIAAMTVAVYFMYTSWLQAWSIFLVSSFFLLICVTDTFYAKIPNLANLALALGGVVYHFHTAGGGGLLFALYGMVVGLSLLLVPWLMGGMGAGDVKALAALGALLGPIDVLQVFILTSLAGGLMAVLHWALTGELKNKWSARLTALKAFICCQDIRCLKPIVCGERLRFPYAAAIAFGFFAHISWGNIF